MPDNLLHKSTFELTDLHINNFVEKFGTYKELITSELIRKKYLWGTGHRQMSAQDRRNLMKLVVEKGFATVAEGNPAISNYKIRMKSAETEILYFDRCIFLDPIIKNLPESERLDIAPIEFSYIWFKNKIQWLEIIDLLFEFQYRGKIDEKCLNYAKWTKHEREQILLLANKQVYLYDLLKYFCQEMKKYIDIHELEKEYNAIFLDLLKIQSNDIFEREAGFLLSKSLLSYKEIHQIMKQIQDYQKMGQDIHGQYTEEDAVKNTHKLNKLFDEFPEAQFLNQFGGTIADLLIKSDNPSAISALDSWIKSADKYSMFQTSIASSLRSPEKRKPEREFVDFRLESTAMELLQAYRSKK